MSSEPPWTKFINHKCFDMRLSDARRRRAGFLTLLDPSPVFSKVLERSRGSQISEQEGLERLRDAEASSRIESLTLLYPSRAF